MKSALHKISLAAGAAFIALATPASANAEQWFFFVKNNSSSKIVKLEVKEKGGRWAGFVLNGGIGSGETAKVVWAESTNSQACNQYLSATFADGSKSLEKVYDFCKDTQDPIVYSD